MFSSLQQSGKLYFQIPSAAYQEQDLPQNHLTSSSSSISIPTTPTDRKLVPSQQKLGRKRSYNNLQHDDDHLVINHEGNEKQKKKKMEHREIERKRRQDMAKLYSSLRSLLPLNFIKGRRSISEHMNQSVNYIKHLQESIKVLSSKRDQLKKVYHVKDSSVQVKKNIESEGLGDCSRHPITVTVSSSHGGIEILIKSYTKQEGFPISRVLKALLQEGLNVISCNSTKVNERLIHSIQSEVSDEICVPVSVLQQKLTELVNTAS